MKTFTVKVNTLSDSDETPDYAVIKLSKTAAKRIKQLNQAVKDLKVLAVEEFDGTPDLKIVIDGTDEDPVLEPWEGTADVVCLRVTDDTFYYTGSVKHSSVQWETEEIDISKLE